MTNYRVVDETERKRKLPRIYQGRSWVRFGLGVLTITLVFTITVALRIDAISPITGTIAGMVYTFLWPLVALLVALALFAMDYRLRGYPLKARGIHLIQIALVMLGIGTLLVTFSYV